MAVKYNKLSRKTEFLFFFHLKVIQMKTFSTRESKDARLSPLTLATVIGVHFIFYKNNLLGKQLCKRIYSYISNSLVIRLGHFKFDRRQEYTVLDNKFCFNTIRQFIVLIDHRKGTKFSFLPLDCLNKKEEMRG